MFRDSINISFKPSATFSLGTDTFICQSGVIPLNAEAANADSYLWNTGAVFPILQASQAGLYWCEANKGGCIFRDSILIAIQQLPIVNLGNDTSLCDGTPMNLDATYLNSTYLSGRMDPLTRCML